MEAKYIDDYESNRYKKVEDGVERAYLYNKEDIVREEQGGDSYEYLHGAGIDEAAVQLCNGSGCASAVSYYYADGLGSVRQLTDAAGIIGNQYRYGAWEELAPPFSKSESLHNFYAYTSREASENNMYYYRARYYNNLSFISKDNLIFKYILKIPYVFFANGGFNIEMDALYAKRIIKNNYMVNNEIYKYAYNNPINYKDCFGLISCTEAAKIKKWNENQ